MSNMNNNEMIHEFLAEAEDMFRDIEEALLEIEKTRNFKNYYNILFRCFHSLKGAAGMFNLDKLQAHVHKIETILITLKEENSVDSEIIDFFLDAVDASKKILNNEEVKFNYEIKKSKNNIQESTKKLKLKVNQDTSKNKTKNHLIYIIDDEISVLTVLKSMFEFTDIDVKSFSNAKEAIQKLDQEHPDAIITDWNMPEMNGLEFMKEANKIYPLVPITLVSGYVTKEICIEALSRGVSGIIEKPIKDDVLINQLENQINKYKAIKLMNRSIDMIIYQFNEFEKFLLENKKEDQRNLLRSELAKILTQKNILFKKVRGV